MEHERKTMKIPKSMAKKNNFAPCIYVLVVDNDHKSLKSLKEMLKQSHCKAVAVDNGERALDLLYRKEKDFNLLLVDLNLTLMNGLDLLEIVATKFKIPVLMMCSKNKFNISVRALKLGASFVFTKPLNKENVQSMWQHVYFKPAEILQPPKSLRMSSIYGTESSFSSKNKVRGHHASANVNTRMVWTPELNQKFFQAINILGNNIQNVFPKQIVKVMNIRGLTRKHVASHLQKYRLSMKSNVVHRNRWNSPNSSDSGDSYDPSAWRDKKPQSVVVPTALQPENGTTYLPASGFIPQFGSQSDNNFMNQGSWQNPVMIDAGIGDTPENFGSTSSNYMMPTVNDQATQEVFPIEEDFQNMSIQSQEISLCLPIIDSGNMDAFVIDTRGLRGKPYNEWSFLDGNINEAGMLNNTDYNNNTPMYEIGLDDMPMGSAANLNYPSDGGKSAMSDAEQTENEDSWLKMYNDATYGNQTMRGISLEDAALEMQQGDDPMSAEDIEFLAGCFGCTDGISSTEHL